MVEYVKKLMRADKTDIGDKGGRYEKRVNFEGKLEIYEVILVDMDSEYYTRVWDEEFQKYINFTDWSYKIKLVAIIDMEEEFNKRYSFNPEDYEKIISRRDLMLAGFIAYHSTEDGAHKSEFNNLIQHIANRGG